MKNIGRSFLQQLPPFKGKNRLAKLLYKSIILTEGDIKLGTKHNLTFVVPNLIENIGLELFINGIYESNIIDFLVSSIPENGIFIDVGANIGAISVVIGKLRKDVTIYAFEASPNVFNYLKLNVEANKLKNINIYNLAIHKTDNLQLPFYSPKGKNGKGSFSSVFTNEAEMVNTISLDTFYAKHKIIPDFIKVDVEGYEKLIFESMEGFLAQNDNVKIIFEFVDWAESLAFETEVGDSQKILNKLNYKLWELGSNGKLMIIDEVAYKGSKDIFAAKK
jgi:FkbM family methyltransferase